MNKIIITLVSSVVMFLNLKGQDINTVFADMPSNIIYGLTADMKESLLENPKDTSKFVSTAIYKEIKRKALNPNYIALQTSEEGMTEIKLLPLINGSKIVCLIQSVCGTICDSKISFYTEKWESIERAELFPNRTAEWFVKEEVDKTSEEYINAIASLTMLPMKFSFSANEDIIKVEFNPESFLPKELYSAIEPFLNKNPKILTWDKAKFQ